MEEKLKEISNDELLKIYRLVEAHLEYLNNEKKKMEDDNDD